MSTFNDIEFSLNFKMRQFFNASPLLLSILINLLSSFPLQHLSVCLSQINCFFLTLYTFSFLLYVWHLYITTLSNSLSQYVY